MADQQKRLETISKMKSELKRLNDIIEAYENDIRDDVRYWNDRKRGLIKHRVIDLKYMLTRLVRELYD